MTYAGHGTRTQRDSLHVVATANPADLDQVVSRWVAVADKASDDAELVRAKLSGLVTTGGWTGAGAYAYAAAVETDILTPLRRIETAARAMATQLLGVQQTLETAAEAASASPVPWDSDTAWHVEQKKLDLYDYLVGTLADGTFFVDPVATLSGYNAAQKKADYDILTGSGAVKKTITAAQWAATQQQTKPMPAVYHSRVSESVHQFDVWMEYQSLNTAVHATVAKAADKVEISLIDLLAKDSVATDPTYTSPTSTTGFGTSATTSAFASAGAAGSTASSGYESGGYTAPGTDTSGSSTGSPAWTTVNETGSGSGSSAETHDSSTITGRTGDPVTSWLPDQTTAAGEGFSATSWGTVATGSSGSGLSFSSSAAAATAAGTSGSTGAGGGMIPAGVGGVGAPSQKKSGTSAANLKVSGMNGVGAGIAGLKNVSFQMGPMGRGTAGAGAVGGVDDNMPLTQAMMGQALQGGRGVKKTDDSLEETDETWLEEDQDVWGLSKGAAVDGLIR